MSLGDGIYRPSDRDVVTIGAAPARFLFYQFLLNTALAQLSVSSSNVPGDEVWVIKGFDVSCTPGAAQTVLDGAAVIRDTSNTIIARLVDFAPPQTSAVAAAQVRLSGVVGDAMVMPGDHLECAVDFNAGANPNSMIWTLYGVRLPRGNILK